MFCVPAWYTKKCIELQGGLVKKVIDVQIMLILFSSLNNENSPQLSASFLLILKQKREEKATFYF